MPGLLVASSTPSWIQQRASLTISKYSIVRLLRHLLNHIPTTELMNAKTCHGIFALGRRKHKKKISLPCLAWPVTKAKQERRFDMKRVTSCLDCHRRYATTGDYPCLVLPACPAQMQTGKRIYQSKQSKKQSRPHDKRVCACE